MMQKQVSKGFDVFKYDGYKVTHRHIVADLGCISRVQIEDKGGLTDSATLNINITDVNDNAPVFTSTSYTVTMSPYTLPGTVLAVFSATDADFGLNALLTYSYQVVHN